MTAVSPRALPGGRARTLPPAEAGQPAFEQAEHALPLDADAPAAIAARANRAIWEESVPPAEARTPGVTGLGQAFAVLPLARGGKVLGTLSVVFAEPRPLVVHAAPARLRLRDSSEPMPRRSAPRRPGSRPASRRGG